MSGLNQRGVMRLAIMVVWASLLGSCVQPLTPMRPTTAPPTTAVGALSSPLPPPSPTAAVATTTETPERVQKPAIIWRHMDNNFIGTNQGLNAVPFLAEERMLAYWAWVVSEEVRSGRSPGWSLALEWGREEDGGCEKLLVTLTGFADALFCDGGRLAELGRKRLSPEELARLYDWHDRLETTQTERFTLSGSGSAEPEEANQQAIDRYAEGLYAALSAVSPGAAGTRVEPLATGAFIHFDSWSPDGRWIAYWLSSPEDVTEQVPYAMPGGTLHFADVVTGEGCAAPQFQTEAANSAFVGWLEDGTAVVIVGEESFKGVPCQSEPFALFPDYRPEENADPDLALSPDGRYRASTALVSSRDAILTFETTLTADGETHPLQTATWQIDERVGDYDLGGQWVSHTQFLMAGYHLWARRVEDVGGEWRLIAPLMDYALWREDESGMVFVQNETTVVWQTFPQGEPVGRWDTGGYWVQPVAFSPHGRYLVALGNKPGEWEYGLFMLSMPQTRRRPRLGCSCAPLA